MENTTQPSMTHGWRRKCFAATTHCSQRYSTWSKGTGDLPLWRRYLRQDLRSQIVRAVPNAGAQTKTDWCENSTTSGEGRLLHTVVAERTPRVDLGSGRD